jgi:hypothetical protein
MLAAHGCDYAETAHSAHIIVSTVGWTSSIQKLARTLGATARRERQRRPRPRAPEPGASARLHPLCRKRAGGASTDALEARGNIGNAFTRRHLRTGCSRSGTTERGRRRSRNALGATANLGMAAALRHGRSAPSRRSRASNPGRRDRGPAPLRHSLHVSAVPGQAAVASFLGGIERGGALRQALDRVGCVGSRRGFAAGVQERAPAPGARSSSRERPFKARDQPMPSDEHRAHQRREPSSSPANSTWRSAMLGARESPSSSAADWSLGALRALPGARPR